MPTLVAVHPYSIFLEGLQCLLSEADDVRVLGHTTDEGQLFPLSVQLRPEIVVAGIETSPLSLNQWLAQFSSTIPAPRVIIMAPVHPQRVCSSHIPEGIYGYVPAATSFRQLLKTIRMVDRGEKYFAEQMIRPLGSRSRGTTRPGQPRLTPREQEVISMVARGMQNSEIGKALSISPDTVRTHRNRIMKKLKLHNAAELTRFAIENDLL